MRELDAPGVETIVVETVPEVGLGRANHRPPAARGPRAERRRGGRSERTCPFGHVIVTQNRTLVTCRSWARPWLAYRACPKRHSLRDR
ncbi:hypothetical protein [Nannocystis radixulma]|uniref:hypothetical protein n=1 Tax=Nannocystis radixulma TaxID=2995305 RepID=UPI00358DC7DD